MNGSDSFSDSRLFKVLGGYLGLSALVIAMAFIVIVILIFIVRIIQYSHLRQQVINHIIGKSTRSVHTRILKAVVFLIFSAGLTGLTFYSVYKMISDPPKLLPPKFEPNTISPSMLFCPSTNTELTLVSADYYDSFNGFGDLELFMVIKNAYSLYDGIRDITGNNGHCYLFDGTLSTKPKDSVGGYYHMQFRSNNTSNIVVFIGDTHDKMDWTLLIPEGNENNDVGVQILDDGGIIQYTETRLEVLDGSYTYRSFDASIIKSTFDVIQVEEQVISIGIIAPKRAIREVEIPSFRLADLFSNIGSYLSVWVVFGFLFGGSKANPFGFVTHFVFINQDREKLLKELEKMKNERKSEISTLEKEVTEKNNNNNQDELRNLLARYYVDMDFYEHAIKSLA